MHPNHISITENDLLECFIRNRDVLYNTIMITKSKLLRNAYIERYHQYLLYSFTYNCGLFVKGSELCNRFKNYTDYDDYESDLIYINGSTYLIQTKAQALNLLYFKHYRNNLHYYLQDGKVRLYGV